MSKIEEIIGEIEDYIANCKTPLMQKDKIICDREEMESLLDDLKRSAPEEIKQVRKIVANKDAIINDAKQKAEALINDATNQTNQLLSEHQIMLQAYAQADEVVACATSQAQQILDNATLEANQVREAAMAYTDKMMADIENILVSVMQENNDRFQSLQSSLDQYYQVVKANRNELNGQNAAAQNENNSQVAGGATGEINIDMM